MYVDLSAGRVGINLPFDALVELVPRHGFEGIDFPRLGSRTEAEHAAAKVNHAGLKWGLFGQPRDFLVCSDEDFATGLGELRDLVPIVTAAGVTRVYNHIFPGHDEFDYQANFERHVDRLKALMDILSPAGVRYGLEFIGARDLRDRFKHMFIHTLRQALELIDAVSPELGIVLDTFHWYSSGGTLEDLALLENRHIVAVHLNDAIAERPYDRQVDKERAMPGETGVIDLVGVISRLRDLNYDGPVVCEPFTPSKTRFQSMPPEEVLAEVGAVMTRLCTEA